PRRSPFWTQLNLVPTGIPTGRLGLNGRPPPEIAWVYGPARPGRGCATMSTGTAGQDAGPLPEGVCSTFHDGSQGGRTATGRLLLRACCAALSALREQGWSLGGRDHVGRPFVLDPELTAHPSPRWESTRVSNMLVHADGHADPQVLDPHVVSR